MKSNSSGIIIINEFKQILICHVCGQDFWDLPKGKIEPNESPIQAAIRETNEETSLSFNESDLIEVGLYNYNKYKNLYLFKTFVLKDSIDLSKLRCSTNHYNEKQNISYPEIDDYKWIYLFDVEYHCSKSMIKIFDIINGKL